MKVLALGSSTSVLRPILELHGDEVVECSEKIGPDSLVLEGVEFVVSYGYRHIVREPIFSMLPNAIINLHISLLPWNRGADPNLWSFLEDTPKGVTIHYMDSGVDTGDIIVQREITFDCSDHTLATTYATLNKEIVALFRSVWAEIAGGKCTRTPQPRKGTCHRTTDKEKYEHLLVNGWDTPVCLLQGKALPPDSHCCQHEGHTSS